MSFALVLLIGGALVAFGAWVWLVVVAFQNKETVWGALLIASLVLLIAPIVGLAFLVAKWNIARRPGILLIVSLVMTAIGAVLVVQAARRTIEESVRGLTVTTTIEDSAGPSEPDPDREPHFPPPAEQVPPGATPPLEERRTARPPARATGSRRVEPADAPGIARAEMERQPATEELAGSQPGRSTAQEAEAGATGGAARAEPARRRDPRVPPVALQVLDVGDPRPNRMRSVRVRIGNPTEHAVSELKLELEYVDDDGNRLGRWTTVHVTSEPIVAAHSTNEFVLQAFFVPQFTRGVRLQIRGVEFENESRWPEVR
jgi:hypothetical protein